VRPNTCGYCGAPGWEEDACDHAADCPMVTGVYPAEDLDRRTHCYGCGAHLAYDGTYMLRVADVDDEDEPITLEVVCLGCAAQDLLLSDC
jgi:hypothetical protein